MLQEYLPALTASQLLFCAAAVLFAALTRAFSGFGFALMAVPVFSLFLAPADAVVLSALLTIAISVVTVQSWWGKFPPALAAPMITGSVMGTAAGVYFLANASVDQFRLWIGLSVIAGCVALAYFRPREQNTSRGLAGATGIASGLMNGAFAIPGPPTVLFVMVAVHEPAKSRAFLMMFFCVSNMVSMSMFSAAGIVTSTPFYLFLVAFPVMLVGDRLGAWLFLKSGGRAYRPFVMSVCLLVGVSITTKALLG